MSDIKSNSQVKHYTMLMFIGALAIFVLIDSASAQQSSEEPLTNAAVVRLVKAGFKEKTIISIINSRANRFSLNTEQLIRLKHDGVSENIILAMLSFSGATPSDEDWADDSFFRDSSPKQAEGSQKDPQGSGSGGGMDIFGSSNGSRSRSSTRTDRGGNENEGNITGSATV